MAIERIWVQPDAYDNPTIWTDGPTPDFPRALLVRVESNADLFDFIVNADERSHSAHNCSKCSEHLQAAWDAIAEADQ